MVMTVDEYLEFERRAELKHEFFAGQIYAVPRTNYTHSLLKSCCCGELGNALQDSVCNVLCGNLRVRTPSTLYTYPDIVVVRGKPEFADDHHDTVTNPIVVVEILSPSTEGYDRGDKFENYRSIPTLQEYVLVSQRLMLVEHFSRQPSGQWLLTAYNANDQSVVFPSLNVSIPMTSLYLKVELPPTPRLRDEPGQI